MLPLLVESDEPRAGNRPVPGSPSGPTAGHVSADETAPADSADNTAEEAAVVAPQTSVRPGAEGSRAASRSTSPDPSELTGAAGPETPRPDEAPAGEKVGRPA